MKKSLMILAASTMILFAACNKEENNGYTINGDKITFGVTVTNPQDEGKQALNGENKMIYFTTGDQIIINGTACNVTPVAHPAFPTSNGSYSPVGQMTADVSSTGAYSFVYPASIFTNDGGVYRATFPRLARAINGQLGSTDFAEIDPVYRPIWPMYYGIDDISNHNGMVELENACTFISPEIKYGPAWATAVFGPLSHQNYGDDGNGNYVPSPTLQITDGALWSNLKLHGPAHLDVTNGEMVMDEVVAGQFDTLIWGAPQNAFVNDGHQAGLEQSTIVGIIPLAPANNGNSKSFKMALTFRASVEGQTYYMLFISREKTTTAALERNIRNYLRLDFDNIRQGTQASIVSYEGGVDNYANNVATNCGHITFNNRGDLYVAARASALQPYINQYVLGR